MMKRYILSIIMLAAMATATAQQADSRQRRVYTLDECCQLAVDNNAKVKIADGSARAAEELSREAFTKYFPTVQAQGLWFHSKQGAFQYNVLDMFTIHLFEKGTTASINAVQPLFAGGRIVNGNKLAKVGVEAGKLERRNAVDDVYLTTQTYYWRLMILKSKKHTLESAIELVDTLEQEVAAAVNAGVLNRNELLKVQLKRNSLGALMVDVDNGIALSTNLLAQYIGCDGEKIDIADTVAPDTVPTYPTDMYIDPTSALGGTADYQLLQAQVRAAELKQKMTVGNYMPTVGLGAGYFYDSLLNQKHSFGALFVVVNVPLSGWWGGSHDIKRSRIEADNARAQMTDLSQMLTIKMQDCWDNLTAAYRKMEIAHESIDQATENLRLNENYYKAGVCTVSDLLDAQTLYRQSHDEYAEAYGNYRIASAQYLDAVGVSVIR